MPKRITSVELCERCGKTCIAGDVNPCAAYLRKLIEEEAAKLKVKL